MDNYDDAMDPQRTALLVMDMQLGIVERIGDATSCVVLLTRQASDLDFTLTVLADGCADTDEEVHRVLTEKVFPARRRC
jgi:nicotinamidase-related amidase